MAAEQELLIVASGQGSDWTAGSEPVTETTPAASSHMAAPLDSFLPGL